MKTYKARLRSGYLCTSVIGAIVLSLGAACTSKPVEEIVTTDAGRVSTLPPAAEPVTREPDLPNRDPDLEEAGDRIGEAITYLDSKRKDKNDAAERALDVARLSLVRLQDAAEPGSADQDRIADMIRELDSSMRAVKHDSQDASKHLADLSKRLDDLALSPSRAKDIESK